MRCIIAGSRTATFDDVWDAMDACEWADQITEVVSGTARGADLAGEAWAEMEGLPVERFPADWDKEGKSAGFKRNRKMADYAGCVWGGNGGACITVWDGESKGTAHMMDLAKMAGLKQFIWHFRLAHPEL